MKKIYYIGFYDIYEFENEKRAVAPSGKNKMDYIINSIERNEYFVNILSPAWTAHKSGKFAKRNIDISKNINLMLCPTFGAKNKFMKFLRKYTAILWIFIMMLFYVSKTDKVIVYHSIDLIWPVYIAKKIKNFKLILEVEEIYQDVRQFNKITNKMEYKIFDIADKYIFSNDLLNKKINLSKKPYEVTYGTYQVGNNRNCKFEDEKIHVVYGGTFDPRKGGVLAAVTAEYLPRNYHMHIIGFGTDKQIKHIQDTIKEISQKTEATVTYGGLLSGEEYTTFLQKCDVGLSTQIPEAAYNETSFPSKILSYMANGLRVVSIRLRAIEMSAVGQAVYYYEEPSPEAIANAIISVDIFKPYDSRELIRRLDEDFVKNIKKLLEG